MALLYGRAGRLTAEKRRFPARAVEELEVEALPTAPAPAPRAPRYGEPVRTHTLQTATWKLQGWPRISKLAQWFD
jgi:hypothetical protein